MYLSFGIMVAVYLALQERKLRLYLLPIFVLVTVLVFCDSRAAVISFVVTMLITIPVILNSRYLKIAVPVSILGLGALVSISPRTSLLISEFRKSVTESNYNPEGTVLRIAVWTGAVEIVKENWLLGVGTGDGEIAMLEKTQVLNKKAFEQKLNAHNQYLETFMTLGIVGFLIVVIMLLFPLVYSLKKRHFIFVSFLLIVGINMLFESVFETFQGIIFFCFCYCLLDVFQFQKKLNESIVVG
jgi:O-antigen ligase